MASTATRKPAHGTRGLINGHDTPQARENRLTGNTPAATGRGANIVLIAAVIAMGLLAGIFLAFDIAIMPAMTAAADRTFVDANQLMIDEMNTSGPFLLSLFGAPALAAVAFFQARRAGGASTARWIVASLAFYIVMGVVSFAVHFPLNDELMEAGDPARIKNLAAVRDDFVSPWVAWNIVRTLALTASFGCLVRALVLHGRLTAPANA